MEEWSDLALMVPATLMFVYESKEAHDFMDVARRKLDRVANVLRRLRMGDTPSDINIPDPPPEGVTPIAALIDARREIARLTASHAEATHIFTLYGEHLGLQGDPQWQSWKVRRADADNHAENALRSLRSAMSLTVAVQDAIDMFGGLPSMSPPWNAWVLAAESLLGRAVDQIREALTSEYEMRLAVSVEHSNL